MVPCHGMYFEQVMVKCDVYETDDEIYRYGNLKPGIE
jgi:hypothetical protein